MLIPHAFKLFDDLYALKGHANKDVRVPAAAAFLAFVQQVSTPDPALRRCISDHLGYHIFAWPGGTTCRCDALCEMSLQVLTRCCKAECQLVRLPGPVCLNRRRKLDSQGCPGRATCTLLEGPWPCSGVDLVADHQMNDLIMQFSRCWTETSTSNVLPAYTSPT